MSDNTSIEWTDATWNPIRARFWESQDDGSGKERIGWHCEHVSEGCRNCYAERMNRRIGTGLDFKPGELYHNEREGYHNGESKLFLDEKMLLQPLRWKKPRNIFPNSMTDLFADFVPDEWIDKIFAVMALTPQHTYQPLTKRAGRMREYFSGEAIRRVWNEAVSLDYKLHVASDEVGSFLLPADPKHPEWPLPNVWLGVSAERQQEWDERKEHLRATPAAIRFASFEPLLGPIVETRPMSDYIQWAIVGGESGPNARPIHPDWPRVLRDQCVTAGVAFFFKQWGEFSPYMTGPGPRVDVEYPGNPLLTYRMTKVGKKTAGRSLDGIEHNAMPEVRR
jgi:protein gp37